ncbi:Transmembrane protein 222 [Labeo rohita]|uniref:Transmembrane protein 222 n=1 Tax=Labeo rohita TaxID=84645 RepID=A0ABQ8LY21_LABRO|nr:Transmembrane protein 222 [Labeo rohita]
MADVNEIDTMKHFHGGFEKIDKEMCRYPHCIVWTPIPVLTDFAGPYFVSEDNMAFGKPTKYWRLDKNKVYGGGANAWDLAHNLCCDNCHSHVAMALNLMRYDNSSSWNMAHVFMDVLLNRALSLSCSFVGFLKTWLPFLMICGVVVTIALAVNLR